MKVCVKTKLIRLHPMGIIGLAVWPFIFLDPQYVSDRLIQHEEIHLKQQVELLVVGFYILYAFYFIKNYIRYRKFYISYRKIPFEIEAFEHQETKNYLENRKRFAWLKLK